MKTKKSTERLALDRAQLSVRSKDVDGRLHVEMTPISKAAVNGYLGKEIPGSEELGLDANTIYQLYRDPEELEKAANSFNGLPVLNQHVPVSASDPRKDAVIGAMGRDCAFEYPYLKNSLTIWDQDAIDAIESGEQKEISSAYRYRPDMTPGVVDGQKYSGVMRDIKANHIAVIERGRAGPDVVVGDSAITITTIKTEKRPMAKKAILSPGAMKAKTTLAQNLKARLAQDADLSDVIELLETLEVDPATVVVDDEPDDITTDDDVTAQVKSICGDKLTDEDVAKLVALLTPATVAADAGEVEADKPVDTATETFSSVTATVQTIETPLVVVPVVETTTVTQPAMDAAIAAAVKAAEANTIARLRAAREAERAVEPYVGKLVAMDSADEVYTAALTQLGVDLTGVHPSAFKAILKYQPLPGAYVPTLAADAAVQPTNDFSARFPTASKIRHI